MEIGGQFLTTAKIPLKVLRQMPLSLLSSVRPTNLNFWAGSVGLARHHNKEKTAGNEYEDKTSK